MAEFITESSLSNLFKFTSATNVDLTQGGAYHSKWVHNNHSEYYKDCYL